MENRDLPAWQWRPDGLTVRQAAVLVWIAEYIQSRGYSPSYREIATEFGMHVHGSRVHVESLEKKGMIRRVQGLARTISITPAGREIIEKETPDV